MKKTRTCGCRVEILKTEHESEITAAHEQTLQTKLYATKIFRTEMDSKFGLWQQSDETRTRNISMPNAGKRKTCKGT